MQPLSLLVSNKFKTLLVTNNALAQAVNGLASAAGLSVPALDSAEVSVSALSVDLADRDLQFTYPRISIYASQVTNQKREKFRGFSGSVGLVAEVWSSLSLEQQTEQALHFYVEGVASLLRAGVGDWGDGVRYSGIYDAQFHPPKAGGFGFVQGATVLCTVEVSFG